MTAHVDLGLHRFEVHRLLNHLVIVPDLFFVDWLTEGPRILMLEQHFKNLVALLLKSAFICLLLFEVGLVVPSSFFQSRDFIK